MFFICFLVFMHVEPSTTRAEQAKKSGSESSDMAVSYGDIIAYRIEPLTDNELFSLSGGDGEYVRIVAARVGQFRSFEPCVDLFDRSGKEVAISCNIADSNRIDVVLEQTGDRSSGSAIMGPTALAISI